MASKKKNNTGLVVTMLIVSVVGGALVGAYVMTTPDAQHIPTALKRDPSTVSAKETDQSTGYRLTPRNDGSFGRIKVDIPRGQNARTFLVNAYLDDLHAKGLGNKNAKLLGVSVINGVAYLDFNQAFSETYGTDDEGTVLNGIQQTLAQFPEIQKMQLRINGQNMESLGNVDLSKPLPIRETQSTPAP